MKTLSNFFCLLSLGLLLANSSLAQKDPSPYNGTPKSERVKRSLLKLNLISPILKSFCFAYEHTLNPSTSFQVMMFVSGDNDTDLRNGFGITPEVRFYLSDKKQSPAGFLLRLLLLIKTTNFLIIPAVHFLTLIAPNRLPVFWEGGLSLVGNGYSKKESRWMYGVDWAIVS
ncbi:MAG: hypothetical protein MUE85_21670 [Microscillaceae bacterium]|jgi:hypothetical protein|nr:hypothetical protein [Microscillaceae bacterium]